MGFLGSLIGGGLGFLVGGPAGAMVGMGMGGAVDASRAQEQVNAQNIALSEKQMEFQKEMSSTAYQRGVKDMEAAGLNPMLAYSQGGASTTSGSMPVLANPVTAGVSSGMQQMQAVSQAMQLMATQAGIDNTKAQTDRIRSETVSNDLNTALRASEVNKNRTLSDLQFQQQLTEGQRYDQTKAGARLSNAQALIAEIKGTADADTFGADVARRKAESTLTQMDIPKAQAEAKFFENLGQFSPEVRFVLQAISSALGSARVLRGGK